MRVLEFLRPHLRSGRAIVSPEYQGWITIYPETTEDQDTSKLMSIAQRLSSRLESTVYATLLHDSDVFCYYLYENGQRLDEYNTRPDYFEPATDEGRAAVQGSPHVLIRFCLADVSERQLSNILRRGIVFSLNPLNWIFADGIPKALAACLGIREKRALCGFTYAEHGEVGEDLSSWFSL